MTHEFSIKSRIKMNALVSEMIILFNDINKGIIEIDMFLGIHNVDVEMFTL